MSSVVAAVCPLDETGAFEDANWLPYLVVRVEGGEETAAVEHKLAKTLNRVRPVMEGDLISEEQTVAAVEFALIEAGLTCLSVEVANGLTWLRV